MKISIIIPTHNSELTIQACLDGVFNSTNNDFEVIIVDDGSTDLTIEKVKRFPCRLIQTEQTNPGHARAIGADKSLGEIMIFIDSDIVVGSDVFSRAVRALNAEPDVTAVVGVLSRRNPYQNFFSVYKNLYMNYIFNICPKYIDFIYGSFFALKKSHLKELPFNKSLTTKFCEDTSLGVEISRRGHKIVLDKTLEVTHLKKYTFFSFVRNDFFVPYYWSHLFVHHRLFVSTIKKQRFCHANKLQILSVIFAPCILISLFSNFGVAVIFLVIFLLLNFNFFIFLCRERGYLFMLRSIIITFADMLIMAGGIVAGFVSSVFTKVKIKHESYE